jgi:hypothetical protein
MITQYSKDVPDIQGLILLDCWEPQVRDHFFKDKYYINLIEQLQHRHFECMVNSLSRLKVDLSDASMANTIKICKHSDNHPLMRNLLQHSGNENISTLLLRYLFNEQIINIVNIDDFIWLNNDYLLGQVKNWLVVGHTWQMCTHEHALGLPNLSKIAKKHSLNFYATDYSFCTLTEKTATLKDFEQDSLKWELVEDFGYQLLPQGTLDKY